MKAGVDAVGSFVGAGEGFFVGAYYIRYVMQQEVEWKGNNILYTMYICV